MAVYEASFDIKTNSRIQILDITSQVNSLANKSQLQEGILLVFSPHTTTAVIINENESRLVRDLEASVKAFIPWDKSYEHNLIDHNAPAHIIGAFLGSEATLPISHGRVELGTWQSIFLLELDGPRLRKVKVKIVGE